MHGRQSGRDGGLVVAPAGAGHRVHGGKRRLGGDRGFGIAQRRYDFTGSVKRTDTCVCRGTPAGSRFGYRQRILRT